MSHVIRSFSRVCGLILAGHATVTAGLLATSLCLRDPCEDAHWGYSTPVCIGRPNWHVWRSSFYQISVLNSMERRCLESWLRVMALDVPALVKEISPYVMTCDSLALLEGLNELRDGVYALSFLLHEVKPHVLEVRRERMDKGNITYLHVKLRLEVRLRLPLTDYTFTAFRLPSLVVLQIQKEKLSDYTSDHLCVTAAEHHWFNGRIWSTQTGSFASPWGDIGDLMRRYNGFMMSTLVTKKVTLGTDSELILSKAKLLSEQIRLLQEEQGME
ncbi:hypothetical protein STCU_02003 [Strigomonas culicis]|uniref:Uncharacterized protein n=1 Tax=Strigomonas culicis TaxID=28005 RepID=S9UY46_9TRYP|nr:hypothetical protein STCU_02003 [Strigomonas culicis]|eukprot:EPY33763.1 hypothetical protein STCU_02003 [Strigomonas culicis]